jgi:hypothetical protein
MNDVVEAVSPPNGLSDEAAALWIERVEEFQLLGSLRRLA